MAYLQLKRGAKITEQKSRNVPYRQKSVGLDRDASLEQRNEQFESREMQA